MNIAGHDTYDIELQDGSIERGMPVNLIRAPILRSSDDTYAAILGDHENTTGSCEHYEGYSVGDNNIVYERIALIDKNLATVCRNQAVILQTVKQTALAVHDAVQALDTNALAISANASAAKIREKLREAKESMAVVNSVVENLEGATEISEKVRPMLEQMKQMAAIVAEMQNNQRKQFVDQTLQLTQINRKLDENTCCSCVVM